MLGPGASVCVALHAVLNPGVRDPWEVECLAMASRPSLDRGNLSWLERVTAAVTNAGVPASEV